jgi:membrane associated rhomboid family serine protease
MKGYPPSGSVGTFGPGPITPAIRALLIANVAVFLVTYAFRDPMIDLFGLRPQAVLTEAWVWQLGTHMFLHDPGGFGHILFNMLLLWMFGVELERRWGSQAFMRYYLTTGVGAGVVTVLVSLLPFASTRAIYAVPTIGASGAIYALLMAWAMLFPHRTMLFMMIFPLPARTVAAILGAIAFFSAVGGYNSGVAEFTHLGGMLVGWLYLQGPTNLRLALRYRLTKWRMERMRKKFDVHKGGRVH